MVDVDFGAMKRKLRTLLDASLLCIGTTTPSNA